MKFSLNSLKSLSKSTHRNVPRQFFCSASSKSDYTQHGSDSLYRRISPIGDPNVSLVPVLNQWINEGRRVDRPNLEGIVKELRRYKRFKHALEVSQWMTDKRYFPMTPSDASARIHLIYKLHGLKHAEDYFTNVPHSIKDHTVYVSLLNCYAHEKSVEKADAIMQKAKDLGFVRTPLWYNIMMNLYYHIKDWEKLDNLMDEMKEKGITYDSFTFGIRVSAYAAASDVEGLDEIVTSMESDSKITMDCATYSVIAQAYLKVRKVEKAVAMLKKLEKKNTSFKRKNEMIGILLKLYPEAGQKDELYRVWNTYSEVKIFNKPYKYMISGLLKFGDMKGAEKILEEWESKGLRFDFHLPDLLINAYCRNGDLEKAEALLNKGIARGGSPTPQTWYYLAGGYLMDNHIQEAVDALKKAISICRPNDWPSKDTLITCVEYLGRGADSDKAEDFMRFLKSTGLFSKEVHSKLFNLFEKEKLVA